MYMSNIELFLMILHFKDTLIKLKLIEIKYIRSLAMQIREWDIERDKAKYANSQ